MCIKLSFTPPTLSNKTPTCIGIELDENLEAWQAATSPYVTAQERTNAQRFVHLIDGVRHLVGRALVRKTLCHAAQTTEIGEFSYTQYGKPYCDKSDIRFSITHSGTMIWVAFCKKGEIGIDVEKVRPLPHLLNLAKMFHPQEHAEISTATPKERSVLFYRCWVRKEAIIKATGRGLSKPLDSFRVYTDQRATDWINTNHSTLGETWFTQDIPVKSGYFCSLATTAPTSEVSIFQL